MLPGMSSVLISSTAPQIVGRKSEAPSADGLCQLGGMRCAFPPYIPKPSLQSCEVAQGAEPGTSAPGDALMDKAAAWGDERASQWLAAHRVLRTSTAGNLRTAACLKMSDLRVAKTGLQRILVYNIPKAC